MNEVAFIHNDDMALDPSDGTLKARGSIVSHRDVIGVWEEHRDGHWSARLHDARDDLAAPSESALKALIVAIVADRETKGK